MRTQVRKYYVEALVVAGVMTLASGIYAALSFAFQGHYWACLE
jgi:hypothetical protein